MEAIKFDLKNARKHGDRNRQTINESLRKCGAGRSIVLDADDVIVAGNGVYEQAQALGLKVRVVETDGSELIAVKRTDIKNTDDKRKLLALADNRTSELAEWDNEALEKLIAELPEVDLSSVGIDQYFLNGLTMNQIIPASNKKIDENDLAETNCECPKCGFKWMK